MTPERTLDELEAELRHRIAAAQFDEAERLLGQYHQVAVMAVRRNGLEALTRAVAFLRSAKRTALAGREHNAQSRRELVSASCYRAAARPTGTLSFDA